MLALVLLLCVVRAEDYYYKDEPAEENYNYYKLTEVMSATTNHHHEGTDAATEYEAQAVFTHGTMKPEDRAIAEDALKILFKGRKVDFATFSDENIRKTTDDTFWQTGTAERWHKNVLMDVVSQLDAASSKDITKPENMQKSEDAETKATQNLNAEANAHQWSPVEFQPAEAMAATVPSAEYSDVLVYGQYDSPKRTLSDWPNWMIDSYDLKNDMRRKGQEGKDPEKKAEDETEDKTEYKVEDKTGDKIDGREGEDSDAYVDALREGNATDSNSTTTSPDPSENSTTTPTTEPETTTTPTTTTTSTTTSTTTTTTTSTTTTASTVPTTTTTTKSRWRKTKSKTRKIRTRSFTYFSTKTTKSRMRKSRTRSTASRRTTTTTTTTITYMDIPKIMQLIYNLTKDYTINITRRLNETLQRDLSNYSCPTETTVTTTTTTEIPTTIMTTTPDPYGNLTGTIMAKCFVCGLNDTMMPKNARCADAFAGDFIPLVPVDATAKKMLANYRKYCRWMNVPRFMINETHDPRSMWGRWTGGCSVRWIDISGIYTQRTCRNRHRAVMGKHWASKRMAKLEMALQRVDNACIISPMASLVPLSRGISLYARFHACVCTGSWCNRASPSPHSILNTIAAPLLFIMLIIL